MKYVYVIKSGSLNKATNTYWFTTSYHSSKKLAKLELAQSLEINRAKNTVINEHSIKYDEHILNFVDYIGEEGRYKGRIILEQQKVNSY